MRVLLLGSDTQQGLSLQRFLALTGRHEVIPVTRAACRWKSERQAKKTVQRARCDVLLDLRLNGLVAANQEIQPRDIDSCDWLAKACQRNDIRYLYLSCSRMFSGKLDRLYSETDSPDCDDELSQLLLLAEKAVQDRCDCYLILRLGPVFSALADNWLAAMLAHLQGTGGLLLETSFAAGSPVAADDAARVTSALLDQLSVGANTWGIYHYCSSEKASAYELVEAALAAAGQYVETAPALAELERLREDRAAFSPALDCRKIRNTFAIKQVPWRDSLTAAVRAYFRSAQ